MSRIFCVVVLILMGTADYAHSGATDTYGIGAKASAMGGAVGAWADDPFAVHYNPAGLSLVEGNLLSVGSNFVKPDINFYDYHVGGSDDPQINGYANTSDNSDVLVAPAFGFAKKINDTWAFGISAYAPWGLEVRFDDNPDRNPAAYNCYESSSTRKVVTPAFSYRFGSNFSMGVGVTLGSSEISRKNRLYVSSNMGADFPEYGAGLTNMINGASMISQSGGGAPVSTTGDAATVYTGAAAYAASSGDSATAATYTQYASIMNSASNYGISTSSDLSGTASPDHGSVVDIDMTDDFNYSFNVGVMYQPSEIVCMGLTYRSRCKAKLEGDLYYKGSKVSDITTDYSHPEQIQGGMRFFFPGKKLIIETDAVWTNWSIVKDQVGHLSTPFYVEAAPGYNVPISVLYSDRKWVDTFQVRLGIEYILNDTVTLRIGNFYDPSPVVDKTVDAQIPDADKRTYSAGIGINLKDITIDGYVSYTDIEKDVAIGGESVNLNDSYSQVNDNTVSTHANGSIVGAGVTVSYKF
jgi:long-chain fatty acid transport protein